MAFTFQVEIDGEEALRVAFSRFGEGVKDFTPAWNLIADDFNEMETNLFNSQGASGGKAWAPLAPSTLRRKKGPSILNETGALRRSLTRPGGHNIRKISKTEARLGTRDPKAMYHYYGTRRMPRREPILITEVDRKRWIKLMQRHLVGLAQDAGLLSYKGK